MIACMTKEFLQNAYWSKTKSVSKIAKEIKCSYGSVYNYMVKFGIKRRTVGESISGVLNGNFGKKLSKEHRTKLSLAMMGNQYTFKGGRMLRSGYVFILSPNHPSKNNNGYVREHHLVIEKNLGRYIKAGEVGHHVDHNRINNDATNLMLFSSHSAHVRFEKGGVVKPNEIIFDGRKLC